VLRDGGGTGVVGKSVDDALDVLTLVLAGLMAGGLLVAELGLVRTIAKLPAATGIRLHVAFDHYVEWSMPALTIATFACAVADLAVRNQTRTQTLVLMVVAIVATAVVAGVSQLVNVPMNATMRSWEPGTAPAEYDGLRDRWNRAHKARTLAGQVALICFAVALATG
jgi:uncharacterized membrane protein